MRTRLTIVLLLAFVLVPVGALAEEGTPPKAATAALGLGTWLTLAPVDRRDRRPFNPDAVFERYLLDPRAPVPHEADAVQGSAGSATWVRSSADDKGRIGGRLAWAYTRVTSPSRRVAMARLRGGDTLFVNGTPHVGAIYGDAFAVPVVLRKGGNDLYVRGVRGSFRLDLDEPEHPVFVAPFRQTKPDLVEGEPVDAPVGLLVVNATEKSLAGVSLAFGGNDWLEPAESPSALPVTPLGLLQVRFRLRSRPGKQAPREGPVDLELTLRGAGDPVPVPLSLAVHEPTDPLIRTFVSRIDDSVQRFALRRPAPTPTARPMGLVLTLHGAGVNPRAQAASYAPKPDFWIVAPTNRDRFGFDWQDWGRIDAYEVLAEALRISGVDRHRVYLTGHSMGGHGTWHLGANDPDGFAAIAPSAGWISFDSYPGPRPKGDLSALWDAADAASKTRALVDNLVQLPTFILHGTKDDNVPITQAKEMERLLRAAGGAPEVHYEPGKRHWWDGYPEPGAQCVDWPGIFDLFRRTKIPACPDEVRFTTVHPRVDGAHYWMEVYRVREAGKPARVSARWDPSSRTIQVKTDNVALLRVTHPAPRKGITVDGVECAGAGAGPVWWPTAPQDPPSAPGWIPGIGSPFRDAWTHRFVMVVGTHGSPEESRALLEQARFDAQRWTYRANGRALVVRDDDLPRWGNHVRTIAYGNMDTNGALSMRRGWSVRRGALHLPGFDMAVGDDLAAWMVTPGNGALVGSTGIEGSRLGFTPLLFVSGAGWPDFVAFDARVLHSGDDGVLEAGWYADPEGGPRHARRLHRIRSPK